MLVHKKQVNSYLYASNKLYKNANQSVPYQPGTVCFPSIEMLRYLPNNTLMMRYIEPLWRKV